MGLWNRPSKNGYTPKCENNQAKGVYSFFMAKKKKDEPLNFENMTPEELLKYEIADEIGLGDKILKGGWKSLTSKESGRIGGLMTKRKRELKREALESDCNTPEK